MKKIIFTLLAFSLLSCSNDKSEETVTVPKSVYKKLINDTAVAEYPKSINIPSLSDDIYSSGFFVLVVDSCEYIYTYKLGYQGGPIFTHKGNCKFCKIRASQK